MKQSYLLSISLLIFLSISFSSCEKEDEPTPTNELMEGKVWQVTEIYSEQGNLITDSVISFFPTYIHLDDANSLNSTAGPLFMYIVYGDSKFIEVTSTFDEIFKYADMQLTEGEWFIDKNKVVDNFTLEVKMRFPSAETLNEVFQILNIDPPEIVADAIDIIVYHKFKFVKVNITEKDPNNMVWTMTSSVEANYYTKDQYGDPVVYVGVSSNSFQKLQIVMQKRAESITSLVETAAQAKKMKLELEKYN